MDEIFQKYYLCIRFHILRAYAKNRNAMTADTSKRAKSSGGKREKFRALAENRTNNALVAIGRIGNLSNRQLYEFEDAEVRKVIKALKDAVSEVENRFSSPKGKVDARFKL
jgi:hypothetical protein